MVVVSPLISQLELAWEEHFWSRFAACTPVVLSGRQGAGWLDRPAAGERLDLAALALDVKAVTAVPPDYSAPFFLSTWRRVGVVQREHSGPDWWPVSVFVRGGAVSTGRPGAGRRAAGLAGWWSWCRFPGVCGVRGRGPRPERAGCNTSCPGRAWAWPEHRAVVTWKAFRAAVRRCRRRVWAPGGRDGGLPVLSRWAAEAVGIRPGAGGPPAGRRGGAAAAAGGALRLVPPDIRLPSWFAPRRADAIEVIGTAAGMAPAGTSYGRISAGPGVPAATVRGWLRRLRSRAEAIRQDAMHQLGFVGGLAGPPLPGPAGSPLGDALNAVAACAHAAITGKRSRAAERHLQPGGGPRLRRHGRGPVRHRDHSGAAVPRGTWLPQP